MPIDDLNDITAHWTTQWSNDVWEKAKGLAARSSDAYLHLGPVLPSGEESRIATLMAHRCIDDEIWWTLSVRPLPDSEPPAAVKDQDRLLGGRAGLIALLADPPSSGLATVGTLRVRFRVPETAFVCSLLPAVLDKDSGHDAATRFAREARLEQIGYRFEGGAGGIEEIAIIYLHKKGQYSVEVTANGPLKLTSLTWLPFANDVHDLALSAFFARREA